MTDDPMPSINTTSQAGQGAPDDPQQSMPVGKSKAPRRSHSPDLPSPDQAPASPDAAPMPAGLHRLSGKVVKVKVPIVIQDQLTAQGKGMKQETEGYHMDEEEFFLDGPVSRSVAVLDFDPSTDQLLPGVRLIPPKPGNVLGKYEIPLDANGNPDPRSRELQLVSVFGTVHRTMELFSKKDALGRPLKWAFGSPQLLVVPRAGEWENAFYERESRSLQFFYFNDHAGQRVHTSLSRDIVAHETAHAILDGIAPDLYDACTPQSLALHEAIADLTALFMAFESRTLRETVLEQTSGDISRPTAFTNIAEQFGRARNPNQRQAALRQIANERTLDPDVRTRDPDTDTPNYVSSNLPHALCEVLTGTLYVLLTRLHEKLVKQHVAAGKARLPAAGEALAAASLIFRRMVFRGLDYLPPGEISFADYGRAILAADAACYPGSAEERGWLRDEFVRRAIVADPAVLDTETNFEDASVAAADLQSLHDSDFAAYAFAIANRKLLCIPEDIPFEVRPRLRVEKQTGARGSNLTRELIFKVAWEAVEANPIGARHPKARTITIGTTLVIDEDTRRVRVRLTSDAGVTQHDARTAFLKELAGLGQLRLDEREAPAQMARSRSGPRVTARGGQMRVRGIARMVHLTGAPE